jgi:putative FmdB family regulatory protein
MPMYDYKCETCGVYEVFQKFSEDTLTECRKCGAGVKKVLTVPGVSGFQNVPNTVSPTYRPDRSAFWNSAQQE